MFIENEEVRTAKQINACVNCGPEDVAYKNNLAMVEVFKKYKINHTFIQGTGGHVWDIWRKNLRDFAPLLFR
jgi:enterochelin esterase-like enzyme